VTVEDSVHVKGLSALNERMQTLAPNIEKNCLRGGLRAGMNPVKLEAVQRIHSVSEELAAGLKIRTSSRGGIVRARLVATGKHASVAHLIEFGTRAHTITAKNRKAISFGGLFFQSIDHPGIAPYGDKSVIGPHAFMRPALDNQAQNAVIAVGEYLKVRLATKEGIDTADILVEGDE
jgi:hypothetical protein